MIDLPATLSADLAEVLGFTVYGDTTLYDILIFTFVISAAVIIARILRTNLRRTLKDRIAGDLLNMIERLVYYTVIAIGVISALPQIGVNLTGLLVAGGIVGLVIGFASQSVVANLISGLFLIFERPVRIGDQINVEGVSGFVEDIHILSTIVRTYDGVYVRIPNEKVFSSSITNYVANVARRFEYTIGISYSDDAGKAVEVIRRVVDSHPFALRNPPPAIFVDSLGDSSVNIVVKIWAPSTVWYDVKMDLLWRIKVELEKEGITIPFPQRVIHFAEGGVKVESGKDVSA